MRLAGDEQHAQILPYPLHGEDRAIVDGCELAGRGCGRDLNDVGAGVVDLDRNLHRLADAHASRRGGLALAGDGQLDRAAAARPRLGHLDLDLLLATDEAEAWGAE